MGDFKELKVWHRAHALTIELYKATAQFLKSELFGLTQQIRRAAVSMEANIAGGLWQKDGSRASEICADCKWIGK